MARVKCTFCHGAGASLAGDGGLVTAFSGPRGTDLTLFHFPFKLLVVVFLLFFGDVVVKFLGWSGVGAGVVVLSLFLEP